MSYTAASPTMEAAVEAARVEQPRAVSPVFTLTVGPFDLASEVAPLSLPDAAVTQRFDVRDLRDDRTWTVHIRLAAEVLRHVAQAKDPSPRLLHAICEEALVRSLVATASPQDVEVTQVSVWLVDWLAAL